MSLASVGEGSTGNEGSRRLLPTFNLVGVSGVCIARSLMQGEGLGNRVMFGDVKKTEGRHMGSA